MTDIAPVRVTNAELATVREAMRELPRLLAQLEAGIVDKLVLTQRNQMRAVLVSVERYSPARDPKHTTSNEQHSSQEHAAHKRGARTRPRTTAQPTPRCPPAQASRAPL